MPIDEQHALKFWKEYVKNVQYSDEKHLGVHDIMVPPLNDEELDEYCKERSGKVKKYKISEERKDDE